MHGTRSPRGLPDPRTAADDGTMRPTLSEQRRSALRATLARQNSMREMLLALCSEPGLCVLLTYGVDSLFELGNVG